MITLNSGNRLHYVFLQEAKLAEDKPLLVFLHEGLGSIAQWKDFPEEISNKTGLPALVYDRYGHGKSSPLKEKRRADFMEKAATEELPEMLGILNIRSPLILIGHSDGATIALYFAAKFPQRTLAVVSEAAHVFLEKVSLNGIKNTVRLFEETRLRDYLKRYHGEQTESMFYGWADTWLNEVPEDWDMKNELSQITSPVLAIQGENDEYGSFEQLKRIKKYCKGRVEVMFIPECGHIPHFQQRAKVVDKILEFIGQIHYK